MPLHRPLTQGSNYAGLWKQIALGIVVGYSVLGVLSAVGWWVFVKLALSGLQITTP
ncbi:MULTISPECIES: hypothetical protein [unclassified Pseudomonas]|uniref:hypothetical protein n=1 Tax=unclassified Pseudomonas TaxID=196821 RepID=UPI00244A3581|nr:MULTISPECIES: hypothetical protein [unclassified Pseudomonas]MDG9928828.1 hypothetical protein [Pseudomonas sp. GD04042]MDH0485667.1 hypothetical protein [Pseudomonas sp. GD04015]MDH0603269.1 hypothetical protein [Pseudomonas sp. GD03869]